MNEHRNNAPATAAISHRHTEALNRGEKMENCRKHQIFKSVPIKKLDEDAHRWTKQ